jgi:hypothetical protein
MMNTKNVGIVKRTADYGALYILRYGVGRQDLHIT